MTGNRRVSPKERSQWRFTFQRLAKDARHALAPDVPTGVAALERLIDLARETKDYDRTDDRIRPAGVGLVGLRTIQSRANTISA
ncbi:hypothetical protein J4573_02415 [Actinomadura barringtoniae]|uniref:Uncharacterized protein n=1 Tax=Actinomadura barringtoniae TaxID=1427535 RepID=A0A939P624_9ACTN|nr:hypothetical protein [Actinomadura barringtoniae]MBO2445933.1 hypothetical protein [Actinomadura barringtoniae]